MGQIPTGLTLLRKKSGDISFRSNPHGTGNLWDNLDCFAILKTKIHRQLNSEPKFTNQLIQTSALATKAVKKLTQTVN